MELWKAESDAAEIGGKHQQQQLLQQQRYLKEFHRRFAAVDDIDSDVAGDHCPSWASAAADAEDFAGCDLVAADEDVAGKDMAFEDSRGGPAAESTAEKEDIVEIDAAVDDEDRDLAAGQLSKKTEPAH